MRWIRLFNKIGKQNLSVTNNENVYALLDFNDSKGYRKIYLELKFDATGKPYLVQDNKLN